MAEELVLMVLLEAWLVFPAILGLLAYGSGLLLEQASGIELPSALRMPAGLAVMVVVAQFMTMGATLAPYAIPVVVGVASAGLLLSIGRRPRRLNRWLVGLSVASFGAYAAPVVLSGQATFTGYVKLDDTATFLGFTDQIFSHGRDLAGLAPSTYQIMLALNIGEGYPIGAILPLGIGSHLTGLDPAWVFQPCMAFYAAMAALALYALLDGIVESRALRAIAALVASQAALLYAYALWGGIKELAAAALIALTAALVPVRREELRSARGLLPFAVAGAATLGVLSVTGIIWVGLLAVPVLLGLIRGAGRPLRAAASGVVALAVFSIPSLVIAHQFIHYTTSNLLTKSEQLGNLLGPLKFIQIFGIWPNGDFRHTPSSYTLTKVLILACALAALAAAAFAVKRGAFRLPLIVAISLVAALLLQVESSPWLAAKALATGSPFLVLLALASAAVLVQSGRRVEGVVLAAFLVGGVLWSNVLGYQDVWLAPRSQLVELQHIGKQYAGDSPALMTEYQPYGVRHFLRGLDAEGASELRVRTVPLVDGSTVPSGTFADLDRFRYPDILIYRTLVLRRSPVESRPSAPYELVKQGQFYDVWERPVSGGPTVLEHIPLGSDSSAGAVPSCATVRQAGQRAAGEGAELAAVRAPSPVLLPLGTSQHPVNWVDQTAAIYPSGSGTLTTSVSLPRAAAYEVWIDGTFFRRVELSIDGTKIGSDGESGGLYVDLGSAHLAAGTHQVTLKFGSSKLLPGSGAPPFSLGPIAFSPVERAPAVQYVAPAQAATLCGQELDWLEIVRRRLS